MGLNTNKKGFTLVEMVVAAAIMSVLVGGGFAFFFVFTKEQKETALRMRAQRVSEMVLETIGSKVREANFILLDSAWYNYKDVQEKSLPNYYMNAVPFRDTIYLYKYCSNATTDNPPFAGFRVYGGRMEECAWTSGNKCPFTPMVLGGDSVFLTSDGGFRSGEHRGITYARAFTLDSGLVPTLRKVEVDVMVRVASNKDSVKIKLQRGVFSCKI